MNIFTLADSASASDVTMVATTVSGLLPLLLILVASASPVQRPGAAMTSSSGGATERGSCWLRVEQTGRCTGLYALNVTRAECCAMTPGGSTSASHANGWAPYAELTPRQNFYWILMQQGAPDCQPCRTTCENFQCVAPKVCRLRHGQPRCVCTADCTTYAFSGASSSSSSGGGRSGRVARSGSNVGSHSHHHGNMGGPVCAFDGRTYRSQCSLSRYNCRTNKDIHVEYFGKCQSSCNNVTCPIGKHCIHDQNAVPHCVQCATAASCPVPTSVNERVCGGDGRTYETLCHLERQACLTGRSVRLAYRGPCRAGLTCSRLRCADNERCLMNELTGTPTCVQCDRPCITVGQPAAQASAATSGALLAFGAMVNSGPGGFEVSRRTVCGSDGLTYGSYCEMTRAACDRGIVIDARHAGSCNGGTAGIVDSVDDYSDGTHVGSSSIETLD